MVFRVYMLEYASQLFFLLRSTAISTVSIIKQSGVLCCTYLIGTISNYVNEFFF